MIEPFFFGSKQLFGVYYPCQSVYSDKLVVICAPLFDEYRRSYRALADFSIACVEKGYHVIRFDYFGTGDAAGDLDDVRDVNEWQKNIEQAIEEGCALSGADAVTLVGVRFGANLAANCQHPAIAQRIFWDPLASGAEYLDWLDEVDQWQRNQHKASASIVGARFTDDAACQFAMAAELRASIKQITFPSALPNTHIVLGKDNRFTSQHNGFECQVLANNYGWPAFEEGLIRPMAAFTQMLTYL